MNNLKVARKLARPEELELSEEHKKIIEILRQTKILEQIGICLADPRDYDDEGEFLDAFKFHNKRLGITPEEYKKRYKKLRKKEISHRIRVSKIQAWKPENKALLLNLEYNYLFNLGFPDIANEDLGVDVYEKFLELTECKINEQ